MFSIHELEQKRHGREENEERCEKRNDMPEIGNRIVAHCGEVQAVGTGKTEQINQRPVPPIAKA